MSHNLYLTVTVFGKDIDIILYQTPSRIARSGLDNKEYKERYIKWIREEILPLVDKYDFEYREIVLEHIARIEFYCEHILHKWSYH